MLILSAADVVAVFGMAEAFDAVAEAALALDAGDAAVPARLALHAERPDAEFLVMPAVLGGQTFGQKLWYVVNGAQLPGPQSSAVITLVDPELGGEVLLDGGLITDLRTGAMTGLAARALAPAGARTAGLIGTGIQARTQVLALVHGVGSLDRFRVFSRRPSRLLEFVDAIAREVAAAYPGRDIAFEAVASAEAACRDADVVVAATTSGQPVFDDAWIGSETLVCGVGSHHPDHAELPVESVLRAGVVSVDTHGGGIDGAGDVARAIAVGGVRREDVRVLAELVRGVPRPAGAPAVFKSVGFSAADVVAARAVARAAIDAGRGHRIDLHRT